MPKSGCLCNGRCDGAVRRLQSDAGKYGGNRSDIAGPCYPGGECTFVRLFSSSFALRLQTFSSVGQDCRGRFNQVSSAAHFGYLKDACKDAGLECLGYLPQTEGLRMPSRHLGLTLTAKRQMDEVIERTSLLVEQYVDIDKLLSLCTRIFPCQYTLPYTSEVGVESMHRPSAKLRIAVARDAAFNFTYRENLDRLSELGKITYFSPVYGSDLPEADLVYLPGGYPELLPASCIGGNG